MQALLQYQRDSLVRKVADLDDASARRSPVGSGTTLLWLIKHMARAEITWVRYRFAGEDYLIPGDVPEPGDTLATVTGFYRQACQQADAIAFTRASLDELCRRPDAGPPVQSPLGADAPAGRNSPPRRACRHPPRANRRPHWPVTTMPAPAHNACSRSRCGRGP